MLARKLFRFAEFRGPTRDTRSDLQRCETVRGAVADALSSLDAEMDGLGRRIQDLRGWVGGLMGPEDCSSSRRDTAAEAELVDAERRLISGLNRLALLTEMRAGYSVMKQAIEIEHDRVLAARLPVA